MLTKEIQENFPFLSVVTYGGQEFVGIIINQDSTVTSMYVYTNLRSTEEQKYFLELGDSWWWESNRLIPINIFLKRDMDPFKYCIVTMNSKDVRVTMGPCVNLNDLSLKRVKRKSIQLVKRPKN
jgi:hypothetical protein